MTPQVDFAAFERLVGALEAAGFEPAARQLEVVLHESGFEDGQALLEAIALAVRAAGHMVGPRPPRAVAAALAEARAEVRRGLPGFVF